MRALRIKVYGEVQGVSFRYFAKRKASELDLSGWAKNEHDGTVQIVIQGERENIYRFLEWVEEGSPMSAVGKVCTKEIESDKLQGFEVK